MWKNFRNSMNSTDSFISLVLGLAVVLVLGMMVFRYVQNRNSPEVAKKQAEEQKKVEEQKKASEFPREYKIVEGDTLWSIAEKAYGNGHAWSRIAEANKLVNPDALEAGKTLTLPKIEAGQITPTAAATTGKPKQTSYTVVSGDHLWSIATRMYDNGYKWTDIARANAIPNPDLIYPGQVFKLP